MFSFDFSLDLFPEPLTREELEKRAQAQYGQLRPLSKREGTGFAADKAALAGDMETIGGDFAKALRLVDKRKS